ncbi:MAG: DUF2530 domain-containing protein [Angustibacter sp.]
MTEAQDAPTPTEPSAGTERRLTIAIIRLGCLIWLAALASTLAVPGLRTEARSWWPGCCAVGLLLGLIGWAYIARGRGNAAQLD